VSGGVDDGLRERKKVATRAALVEAAWRLTAERGLARVRVEDIAAAAGVSARTFNNYFANKEDALVAVGADRADRVAAALRARPAAEPLWEALATALVGQFFGPDENLGHYDAVYESARTGDAPELVAAQLRLHREVQGPLAQAVADRLGMDVERDLYPKLVASTVGAVTRTTVEHWRRTAPDTPFPTLLREALAQVAAGLPVPGDSS
jgi:AcrR family transcriptional regulator